MATCRISQSAEGKIIKPWNLYAVAELMEDREEPPPHPWQAKCEIRDLLS